MALLHAWHVYTPVCYGFHDVRRWNSISTNAEQSDNYPGDKNGHTAKVCVADAARTSIRIGLYVAKKACIAATSHWWLRPSARAKNRMKFAHHKDELSQAPVAEDA